MVTFCQRHSLQRYLFIWPLHPQDHTDWITNIEWVPEVGLVTSSLDSHIKVCAPLQSSLVVCLLPRTSCV